MFETYKQYVPEFKKEKVRGAEKRLKRQQKSLEKRHRTIRR
jgi:hypothetical protein